jgi:hypothetical protein
MASLVNLQPEGTCTPATSGNKNQHENPGLVPRNRSKPVSTQISTPQSALLSLLLLSPASDYSGLLQFAVSSLWLISKHVNMSPSLLARVFCCKFCLRVSAGASRKSLQKWHTGTLAELLKALTTSLTAPQSRLAEAPCYPARRNPLSCKASEPVSASTGLTGP